MKYKKGDIIKIKNYKVKGKFGQLSDQFFGKTATAIGSCTNFFEPFKVEIMGSAEIIYLEVQEIQCKIKDNKLNRKLYDFWDKNEL